MKARGATFLAGGTWELIRFTVVFLLAATAPSLVDYSHLLMLWLGAPALVLAALFFATAYYEDRLRAYLPMLQIGAALTALSDVAVVLSRTYDWADEIPVVALGRFMFVLVYVVLVADLVVVALLLVTRAPESRKTEAESDDHLPLLSEEVVPSSKDESEVTKHTG